MTEQPFHDLVAAARPNERFWSKVERTDTCWLWRGTLGSGGYGLFSLKGRNYRAHRVAFVDAGGVIASGLQIDHLCRALDSENPRGATP